MSIVTNIWQLLNAPLARTLRTATRGDGAHFDGGTHRRLAQRHALVLLRLRAQQARLNRAIATAEKRRDGAALRRHSMGLARTVDSLRTIEWMGAASGSITTATLVISSWLLRDSFVVCTETAEEGMHFIAGFDLDGLTIATRIIRCRYASRSWASARSDQVSVQKSVIASHERGHHLAALVHAHPGTGRDANHPSSVDLQTHQAFEQTSRIIGGIFSRDGFVRWFSAVHPFQVVVVGSDVEQVDEHLFRLNMDSPPLDV